MRRKQERRPYLWERVVGVGECLGQAFDPLVWFCSIHEC